MMVDAGIPLIAVVDHGIGFDAKSSRGLGLLGMEERLLAGVTKSLLTPGDHDKEIRSWIGN